MVWDTEKPSFLEASCCNVEVVNGGAGLRGGGLVSTLSTWEKAVLTHLEALNREFKEPLPYSEIKATARSISNYCWKKFSHAGFSEWQSNNAKRANAKGACSLGGKAKSAKYDGLREQAKQLRAEGLSFSKIAIELGCTKATAIKWCKPE